MSLTQLHIDLLIALRAPETYGLGLDSLLADMRRARHRNLSEPELLKALRDLADKCFVEPFTSSTGSNRWCITGRGKAALNEDGL